MGIRIRKGEGKMCGMSVTRIRETRFKTKTLTQALSKLGVFLKKEKGPLKESLGADDEPATKLRLRKRLY